MGQKEIGCGDLNLEAQAKFCYQRVGC